MRLKNRFRHAHDIYIKKAWQHVYKRLRMDNIKIVKLMGGIGNQMFQYAFGYLLEQKFNCKVLFDTSYFDEMMAVKNGLPSRVYELNIFNNINLDFAPKELVDKYSKKSPLPKLLCSILRIPRYKYFIREKNGRKRSGRRSCAVRCGTAA